MAKIILAVCTVEPHLTNLYTTKSWVKGTTFFNPEIVKYMKKKLDIQPNLSIVNKCTNFPVS